MHNPGNALARHACRRCRARRTYGEAMREATEQEMERDARVVLFGLDVDDPKAI